MMRRIKGLLLGSILTAGIVCSAALAQQSQPFSARSKVSQIELQGVHLLMTPSQVEASLEAQGYRLSRRNLENSWLWKVAVRERALGLKSAPVGSTEEKTIGSENWSGSNELHLYVRYKSTKEGAFVDKVVVEANASRIAYAEFAEAAVRKFGEPARMGLWCNAKEPSCTRFADKVAPWAVINGGGVNHSLAIEAGTRFEAGIAATVEAEVQRRHPRGKLEL